jgi:hypothetical protein
MFENACIEQVVGRLPSELMAKLPSFLLVLFDAFDNRNAEVRKRVVFCVVRIYIVLGKAFVPYLGSLSSTQLLLVSIDVNCICQVYFHLSTHCHVPGLVNCTNDETIVNFINKVPGKG